jgi:hypothetical protein
MAKSISLAKQLTVQGSPAAGSARTGVEFEATARPRVCAISAQDSANPERAAQTHCQSAAHRQAMTAINDTFHQSRRPWRIRRRPKPQPVATSPVRGKIGLASSFICFILALLTVLSVTPVFLLFCACELSPSCLARGFGNFLIGPGGVRKPAVAIMLGPLFVLLAYVVVFVRCHRRRDVLDFTGRSLG